jgi:hypothetical protein
MARDQIGHRVRRQQRNVSVGDRDDALEVGKGIQRAGDRVASAELAVLNDDRGGRRDGCKVLGELVSAVSNNDHQMLRLERLRRSHGVADQRPAGQLVQDFGDRRFHPRALTGSEDDDSGQACAHARAPRTSVAGPPLTIPNPRNARAYAPRSLPGEESNLRRYS